MTILIAILYSIDLSRERNVRSKDIKNITKSVIAVITTTIINVRGL